MRYYALVDFLKNNHPSVWEEWKPQSELIFLPTPKHQNNNQKKNKQSKPKRKPSPYKERNKALRRLGFRSYGEYLNSGLWLRIRNDVFESKGYECSLCGERATQIHHTSYDRITLTGRSIDNLHPVCHSCHESIEMTALGGKRSFNDSLSMFMTMKSRKPESTI